MTLIQVSAGGRVSRTVTVAEQLAVLELLSVTVRTTGFPPRFPQLKLVVLSDKETVPQANAIEPLSIAAAVMDAFPDPFRNTVRFWHKAVGLTVSITVTVDKQLDVFPDESVSVRVIAFAPMFTQVKVVGFATLLAIPQTSEDPLSICAAVMLVFPKAFN